MSIILKLLLASLIAFSYGLVIPLAAGKLVPAIYGPSPVHSDPVKIYSLEDLQKAEKDMKASVGKIRKQSSVTPSAVIYDLKVRAFWILWVPWLLLPLLMPIRTLPQFLLVLAVPALAVLVHLAPPEELLMAAAAAGAGTGLRAFWLSHKKK